MSPQKFSLAVLAAGLFALCAPAAAQHGFEQTYTEIVDEVVELPSGFDASRLSPYELTQVRYNPPDTVAVTEGYDDARGLYEVRRIAHPRSGYPAWRRRVPAEFVRERGRSYVLDEDGELLSERELLGPTQTMIDLEREAAAGRVEPYRLSVMPDDAALAAYLAAGYEIVDAAVARRGPDRPASYAPLAGSAGAVDVASALTLRGPGALLSFDTASLVEAVTRYTDDGTVESFQATQYTPLLLASGERILVVGKQLRARPDTLLSGIAVTKTIVRTRSGYGYRHDGRDRLAADEPIGSAELTVFPNPLVARRVSVLLPAGAAGAARVRVFDAGGRQVSERRFGSTEGGLLPVELPADLTPGTYALRVELDHGSWTRQLIVR